MTKLERHERLAELEQLSAADLKATIEADPAAVARLLRYLEIRGEVTPRQIAAGIVSGDILAKAAGAYDGSVWRKWIRGEFEFGLGSKRAIIWAAWGEPAK